MNDTNSPGELLDTVAKVLIRCFFMGIAIMLLWAGILMFAGDIAYNVHSAVFQISRQQFDCLHYAGIGITKISIFLFFLLPYIAIRLVLKKTKQ